MLGMLFLCRTALGLEFETVGSAADSLGSEFHFSHAQIGTLIGMFMLPGMLVALPSGYAGRYVSDRVLVGIGLLALALGGFVASQANGFDWLAAGRIACGVGFVLSSLYFSKMTVDWFAGKELATAMAVLVVSWPFGIAAGQIGYPWLAEAYGWRATFYVPAGYCVAAAALVFLSYRPPARHSSEPDSVPLGLPWRELALTLIASLVWALFNAAYIVYLSFAPQVLVENGYAAAGAAAVISLSSWTMIISGPLWGHVADRTGRRDLVLYVGLTVGVGSLLSLSHASLAVPLSLAFGFMGVAPAGIIMALTGESMSPQRRAFGMGIFLTGYYVLVAPAPAFAGWLFDRSGDASRATLFAAALFAAAALANFAFRLTQKAVRVRLADDRPSP